MKKKIKDVTIGEARDYCDKQNDCDKCPFYRCCVLNVTDDYLNAEITLEVEE